jgi:hypothetical protein
MTLLTFADMREDSLAEFAAGCALGEAEASDANITAAIVRLTDRFQDWTNDIYQNVVTTVDEDGIGGSLLRLRHRTTVVSSVTFRLADGTYTSAQAVTAYRLISSLNATGDDVVGDFDYLEVVPYSPGFSPTNAGGYPYLWPIGPQIVRVTGTFGWTVPPADAKRAIAMLVWHHFKPIRADLGRATSWQAGDTAVTNAIPTDDAPSGIPDVDQIIRRLRRNTYIGVS